MIHYLKRHQIDDIKYDTCIDLATNSRVYAYSWYLDIVADNWDALILNDYEAVMPLPWRSKYFIKYVYPPAWTQQLGVFSEKYISKKLISDFIKEIPKKFKKITIQFNSSNDLSLLKTIERVNYILPLNKPYKEIYKGFNKNRKRILNKKVDECKINNGFCIAELILIAKKHYTFLNYTDFEYNNLKVLVNYLLNKKRIILYDISNLNNELIGGIIFFKSDKRITYLFSIMTPFAKKNNISSGIINLVLEEYSNSNYIFDFEGSMNLGISNFFKSFGSIPEFYYQYKKYRLI